MKKGIQLAIYAVVSLCVCWFAGQQMKAALLMRQEGMASQEEGAVKPGEGMEGQKDGMWNLQDHMDSDQVTIEGRTESSDYPYGYNAGAIEDDQVGRAVLLTPDTAIGWEGVVGEDASLILGFFLHPWVADDSDGALLIVTVTVGGTARDYVYEVGADLQEETLALENVSGEVQIKLAVSNKEGQIADCDWVILAQCTMTGFEAEKR